jgi:hypothetical protein
MSVDLSVVGFGLCGLAAVVADFSQQDRKSINREQEHHHDYARLRN